MRGQFRKHTLRKITTCAIKCESRLRNLTHVTGAKSRLAIFQSGWNFGKCMRRRFAGNAVNKNRIYLTTTYISELIESVLLIFLSEKVIIFNETKPVIIFNEIKIIVIFNEIKIMMGVYYCTEKKYLLVIRSENGRIALYSAVRRYRKPFLSAKCSD